MQTITLSGEQMETAAAILVMTLLVFTLGRSPLFRVDRAGVAIIGAALAIGLGVISFDRAVGCIDHRTLVILFAMMIIAAELKLAGFFELAGHWLLRRIRSRRLFLLAVILISGVFSAICINDIVCLLFTPMVLLACRKMKANPVPYLLGVALASNIGSAATLVGNPQNILIASLSGLSFAGYFLAAAPVSAMGLAATHLILCLLYRQELAGPMPETEASPANTHPYLIGKGLLILSGVLGGFVLEADMAIVSILGAAAILFTRRIKPNKIYTAVDFNLLVIFAGLFVIIGSVESSGLMDWLLRQLGLGRFDNYPVFALATIGFSNLFSNVPAVLLLKYLIPAQGAAQWWTGLAVFSTVAGNLTITGSIANLIVAEIARRDNIRLGFLEYLRAGLPLTVMVSLLALLLLPAP